MGRSELKQAAFSIIILGIIIMAFGCGASIYAQVSGATLSGTVTDPTGAVVPGVKVSVKNTETGVTRAATTNSVGFYTVPNLTPGSYAVAFSAHGFTTLRRTGITLTVGASQQLNVTLKIGSQMQTVQVTGAAPIVQLSSSTVRNVVNSTTVRQLPLNGRSWTNLATLQPGGCEPANAASVQLRARAAGIWQSNIDKRPEGGR